MARYRSRIIVGLLLGYSLLVGVVHVFGGGAARTPENEGRAFGAAVGLLVVAAVVPGIVWWWRRRRNRSAGFPTLVWLVCGVVLGVLMLSSERMSADQDARSRFAKGFVSSSRKACGSRLSDGRASLGVAITDAQIATTCACYADKALALVTPDVERQLIAGGKPPPEMVAELNDIIQTCLASVVGG